MPAGTSARQPRKRVADSATLPLLPERPGMPSWLWLAVAACASSPRGMLLGWKPCGCTREQQVDLMTIERGRTARHRNGLG
eukprot:1160840-Pelagomonas_calceolata.AAC.4